MKLALVRVVSLVALFIGGGLVAAQVPSAADLRKERDRIAHERAAAEARFNERQRECLTRFVATSCVEDAKRDRRETIGRLRNEQIVLEENDRRARAAARTEAIRRKTEAAAVRSDRPVDEASREPKSPRPERPPRAARAAEAASAVEGRSPRAGKSLLPPSHAKSPARSADDQARSRATFEAAQRAAEEHRAQVEARNAARAARRMPAAPLPLPPGASAP
jgi:hypothetical protein